MLRRIAVRATNNWEALMSATKNGDASHTDALADEGFILLTDLKPIVPLHPQHIRKLIKRDAFPKPVRVGGRTAFRRKDIRNWCLSRQ